MVNVSLGPGIGLYNEVPSDLDVLYKSGQLPLSVYQVFRFCDRFQIPIFDLQKNQKSTIIEKYGIFGNQFTIFSRRMIQSLNSPDCVNGIELIDLEQFFLNNGTVYEDLDLRVNEFLYNPENFFPGVSALKNPSIRSLDSQIKGFTEGFKLIMYLMSQRYYKFDSTRDSYEKFDLSIRGNFFHCTQAEPNFISRLDPDNGENFHSSIFYNDRGEPIFFQKTGDVEFDKNDNLNFSSTATCINLTPVYVQKVLYPAGTIFGLNTHNNPNYVKNSGNQVFHIDSILGVTPLRLSIFSIKERNDRIHAFGSHYLNYSFNSLDGQELEIGHFRSHADEILRDNL